MFYTYDDEFFNNIIKPALVPPKWVFRYVWTILFLLMFAALIIIMTKPASLIKYFSIGIFFLQLAVNLYWTKVFFKEHNIKKALAVAILLTVLVFVMIIFFFKLSFLAGFLLLPYLFWLGFACILIKLLLDLDK